MIGHLVIYDLSFKMTIIIICDGFPHKMKSNKNLANPSLVPEAIL